MKLIISGATGFVATEVLRQSLRRPEITTVVALSRKPVSAPDGTDAAKLKSVVVEGYSNYPEHVRREFADANACIWTVAVTIGKSRALDPEEVRRVCQTYTMAGLQAMYDARPAKPFRFLYMSGLSVERDQTKPPAFMPEYVLMRGETENQVLDFAAKHKGEIEACVAKPGYITGGRSIMRSLAAMTLRWTVGLPNMGVEEVAAAMLDQVVHGFEKEPLLHDDLIRIGQKALHAGSES